ncbi:MurR/RpiR family transcriptional regulator [Ensifer sp. 2YAB10]|uniref:MurR/RpiR family transcriptional regulator n=1 Tax=Ensifer sp. 2YAB10 TaxID=3233021 RepID=UPI003F9393EC
MAATLSPKSEFASRMAAVYASLSKSHRKIADFVLARPLDVVAMSIEGVAQASGSSTATITRFVRAAGYNGFSEFREKIVSDYQIASGDFGEGARDPAAADFADSMLHRLLTDNVRNIQDAISNIEPQTAGMFVDALTVARRIIILGSGASHYAAAYLEEGLALYTEKNVSNVLLRGATQYSNNVIRTISDGDVVVAISMPRYSNSTVELTKVAKTRGAKVLVITDSPTSPLAPLADVIFFAPAKSRLLPNSPAAIFALADALIATIAGKRPDIVASTFETPPEDIYL